MSTNRKKGDFIVHLKDAEPIFEGMTRAVYRHPSHPDYLIKIPKDAWEDKIALSSRFRRWRKSWNRNSNNLKELMEMMRLNPMGLKTVKHMVQIVGMIWTDIGWGLVVKAERDQDGHYAKPLEQRQDDIHLYKAEIEEFIHWAQNTDYIYHDLKADNIVLAWRDNAPQVVLVDGIGESGLILRRTWFRKHNRHKNNKELAEFIARVQPFMETDKT